MEDNRPNPEAILAKISEEDLSPTKGKLKIFFGYAAGVGKTYAMLMAAHEVQAKKIRVLAGYIEPHLRKQTQALLFGLDILPPKVIKHKGICINEFDLDAAIEANPQLILVDELAHTNDPTCRHTKRYQDIYELLDHGIDVYTTLNVQHIESLNDIIASFTSIVVSERIPDHVFDDAFQVELVDIEPLDLLERLKAGLIYNDTQVQGALSNFFIVDNLIALREIALRRCADRASKKLEKVKGNKEAHIKEHILMCLSASPTNKKVIRTAARLAGAFFGELTAIYVETPNNEEMSETVKETLASNVKLARQLGAKIVTLDGDDIPFQISEYAKSSGISKIVLGRTSNTKGLFRTRTSFVDKLTLLAPEIDIYIIPDGFKKTYSRKNLARQKRIAFSIQDTTISLSILVIVVLLGLWFQKLGFVESNIIMLHILGVLITSLLTKNLIYTLLASLVSVLSFNFFFTLPQHSFNAYDAGYPITFLIMFITAFVTGTLTKRVKEQARISALKAYRFEILLESSQKLQSAKNQDEIIEETSRQIKKLLNKTIIFYRVEDTLLKMAIIDKIEDDDISIISSKDEEAVVTWVMKNNRHAGASTTTLPGAACMYLAVRNKNKVFGVVGIYLKKDKITSYDHNILMAILNESSLALEKEKSYRRQQEIEIKANQEELRANLLRSISHDLRTPLTSISGNAGILLSNTSAMEETQKQEMYHDIYEDAMWLINLVENLLSITRIENGNMQLHCEVELVNDIVSEAMLHINKDKDKHIIKVNIQDEFLFAKVDSQLIMQVIINIVNNAIKYTYEGSTISIEAKLINKEIVILISDNGKGISDENKVRLFEMFFTQKNDLGDSRRGLGLGLALCKSIIEAHDGSISVSDNTPSGTIFKLCLPYEEVTIHE